MTIYFGKANENTYDYTTLFNMLRFRHKIFHDRLKWDVNSLHGMEFDEFDILNPHYMIAADNTNQVEACWRIMPTTGPYMLKDTFPQLLRGDTAPQQDNIWELSRFAVAPNENSGYGQAILNELTFKMFQKSYEFAITMGISSYVTVTSVAVERMLMHAGFPMRRFGDGKSQKVGKVTTVACWMDINEQYHKAAYEQDTSQQAA